MDRLLDVQILDPSMGSGHFLVEALNRISVWATDVLNQYPDHPLLKELDSDRQTIISEQKNNGIKINTNLLTPEVLLKRKIMKRCIFGVDLNPMAVDLTKLSLWLDSFAIGTPLTYLDHHIKIGDSTIGSRLDELIDTTYHTLDDWIKKPDKLSKFIDAITHNTDITISQVQQSKTNYDEYLKQIMPYKFMLDALTAFKMDPDIIPIKAHKNLLSYLIRLTNVVTGKIKNPDVETKSVIDTICIKTELYKFFHWDIEMMDAFADNRTGFDLIVGNPPWDKVRPNAKEFFTNLEPDYKQKSEDDMKKIQQKYKTEFEIYENILINKRSFYKRHRGIGENTDFDLYRIVVERMFTLLAVDGVFSMVMPSAIVNSRGAMAIRKWFLSKKILGLFVFENKEKIFPIHAGQKFALLTFQNKRANDKFPAGFYLHKLKELNDPADKLLYISKKKINEMSPTMSIIYEFRSDQDYVLNQKLSLSNPKPTTIQSWSVDFGRELNLGEKKDKKLLTKNDGSVIFEPKNFHQYISNYTPPRFFAHTKNTLKRVETISKFHHKSKEIHENTRLVYRNISSATNTRTMIACIIPKSTFTTAGTYMAIPRIGLFEINQNYHKLNSYLCGIFNSTTYDYMIRTKIDKHVETYHLNDTPIPEDFTTELPCKISKLSAILTLAEIYDQNLADALTIDKKTVSDNTLINRIKIISEIDALVAIHYGANRNEYIHILNSFKHSKKSFSDQELSSIIDYSKLAKGERDQHMKIFYSEIYKRAPKYYDEIVLKIRRKSNE